MPENPFKLLDNGTLNTRVVGNTNEVSYGALKALAYDTSTDWDNATSESGVVHESVTNTDHSDAGKCKKGYRISSPYKSGNLVGYWPLHENSGSTSYDFSGNNDDLSVSGPSQGQTSILGTTGYNFDGTDDQLEVDPFNFGFQGNSYTVSCWLNPDSGAIGVNNRNIILGQNDTNSATSSNFYMSIGKSDTIEVMHRYNSSDNNFVSNTALTSGTWYFLAVTFDTSNNSLNFYLDGATDGSSSPNDIDVDYNRTRVGYLNSNFERYAGTLGDLRVYNTALSSSEVQTLYDVVDKESTLTTASKSFRTARKVDLVNLSYTLNGESITLDITGSPGTADAETVTQSLDGASSYSLSWNSGHTDYEITAKLDTTDVTTTPSIDYLAIE